MIAAVPPEPNLDHRTQLLRAAAVILAEEFKARHRALTESISIEEHMREVFDQVSADELSVLPAARIAQRFGCSRRHLNRLFHKYFGLSVAELRLEIRLMKAVSLLRNSKEKIINVAEKCHFSQLGAFNIYFKRRFGCSPAQWRRIILAGETAAPPRCGERAACRLQYSGLCPLTGIPTHLLPPDSTTAPAAPAGMVIRVTGTPGPRDC